MQRPSPFSRGPASGLLLAILALSASADVVVLKDGRRIEGTVVRDDQVKVVVNTGLAELEFERALVVRIERGKTARAEFAAREAKARTADEFFALGNWAQGNGLESLAKKAWKRALELDGDHAGARAALGFVRHEGEWLTTGARDERVQAAREAALRAQGLVQAGDRWVTPQDKEKLDAGLVEVDGRWVTPDEARRLSGLELFEGQWLPRSEALARTHAAEVARQAGISLEVVTTSDALVAGPFPREWLSGVGHALAEGRAWFDRAYGVESGLGLYAGALAEFYLWSREAAPYVATVDHFAALTPTVTPQWAAAVKSVDGLYWFDPYPLSSARLAHRPLEDLSGHCLHHLGHLMAGRLFYDGKLLAPWYDEALASLVEFRVAGRNAVFCRARGETLKVSGTQAAGGVTRFDYDPALLRNGHWEQTIRAALEAAAVPPFDRLAHKQFSDLELIDVAQGMAILSWLESRAAPDGERALGVFHAQLRHSAPALPERVIPDARVRLAAYDAAFRAASGLGLRQADQEWRTWLSSR